MGQVIVTMGRMNVGGRGANYGAAVIAPNGASSDELSTSGTATASTITAREGDYAVVENVSASLVWVRFNGTAAVSDGSTVTHSHPVPAASVRAFGPLSAGQAASVIDDS